MEADSQSGSLEAFWRTLTKVDRSKIHYGIALRNAFAVALPLAIGIALHNPLGAVAITTGALNVSYSDGTDPYKHRALRMLGWTMLGGVAVFIGSVTGNLHLIAILIAATWAFFAGLGVAVSTRIGDLGLNTLVALIVFAARGAMDLKGAATAGALVIAGGLLQTLLAVLFWPLRHADPERRAVSAVYSGLADEVDPETEKMLASPIAGLNAQVQETIDALGREHTTEADRMRLLFDQADRIRMSSYVLVRLKEELGKAPEPSSENATATLQVDKLLHLCARLLAAVGTIVATASVPNELPVLLGEMQAHLREAHGSELRRTTPFAADIAAAMNVLAGQIRVATDLAKALTGEIAEFPELPKASLPWRLRFAWISKMRANLDWRSVYFRHAVRMAILVAAGDAIGRSVSWQRSYWLPMTIAVVLKPDFVTTYSRGILRLTGTFTGLLLATLLYHLTPQNSPNAVALSQLMLVGVFTFALRSIGTTNYGAFSFAVSGLIVFLVAATGVPPKDVVTQRAINTVAGGLFALAGYALWPSWERTHVGDALANMIDASRQYFQQVALRLLDRASISAASLNELRASWRVTRSNAEASVDRVSAEPRMDRSQMNCLSSILASSHSVMRAMVALDAGVIENETPVPKQEFSVFVRDVEYTLYFLAASLRGSQAASSALPQLREDHRKLVAARDQFVPADEFIVSETDRLTVSLNTLREQVMRYVGAPVR